MSGSGFTPRLHPRPQYPPLTGVLLNAARIYLHDVVFGVALTALFYPLLCAVYAGFTLSDRVFFSAMVSVAHTGTYVLFNGGLLIFESFGQLDKYKLSRKPAEVPTKALYTQLLTEAAVNHLLVSPLVALGLFSLSKYFGMPAFDSPLPSLGAQVCLFAAAHAFNDVMFYFTHRLMHHPKLYARFHKQHHAFRGSVGAAAEFAGPVEVVVSNQFPTVGFLLLYGAHPLIQSVWVVLRLVQTFEVHSGYDFRESLLGKIGVTSNGTAFHDHHHTVNTGNFGSELMDWLMGTMDVWVRDGGEDGYVGRRLGKAVEASTKKNI